MVISRDTSVIGVRGDDGMPHCAAAKRPLLRPIRCVGRSDICLTNKLTKAALAAEEEANE